ncbi:uncharacterized protein LOC123655797 [Melitaea cinxia]|uniref:uncharacterized protein LOC123655797 n=1 Tax=Melitaea cinxia TaxID=113334 RepID=UPI001E2727E3|nr:uncharacterized protein LOC123655797 [Melitaea cinxia]
MRYLGLTLDGRWAFGAHFAELAPRVVKAAASLGRLLPNVGGPSAHCRRLYSGIIRSMAMYGAPVWADALGRANKIQLRRPQRVIVTRAIRGYRTVSWTAACVLAGDSPWALQVEILAETYHFGFYVYAMKAKYACIEVMSDNRNPGKISDSFKFTVTKKENINGNIFWVSQTSN